MTERLFTEGYVASYNSYFFEETYNLSGAKGKGMPDYFHDRRFYLLSGILPTVRTLDQAKEAIRYLDNDDLCNTICPRCDLVDGWAFGCVDGKVLEVNAKGLSGHEDVRSWIISGPPIIDSKEFCFDEGYPHRGIPGCFDFEWVYTG